MPAPAAAATPRINTMAALAIIAAGCLFMVTLAGGLLYICLRQEPDTLRSADQGPSADVVEPVRTAKSKPVVSKPLLVLSPETQQKVNNATRRGLEFLRRGQFQDGPKGGSWQSQPLGEAGVGLTALAGLTMLECNVPPGDRAVQNAARYVRDNVKNVIPHQTYQISLALLFLCRLDDNKDRPLIRSLALRLVANQHSSGGWSYGCEALTEAQQDHLLSKLKAWPKSAGEGNPWKTSHPLGVFHPAPTSANTEFWLGGSDKPPTDNSNTQFALLALWAARRYDLPLDPPLQLVARRFRNSQEGDGQWYYMVGRPQVNFPNPTMTAAGLLGLAVGYGLDNDSKTKLNMADDAVLQNGLKRLAQSIGQPGEKAPNPPTMYFLWSVERVAVLYQQAKIDGKDWFHWGVEILETTQHEDGHWHLGGVGAFDIPDTCFALLFLQQANLIKDLTDKLQQLLQAMQDSRRKE
jgi:hypothetical protein